MRRAVGPILCLVGAFLIAAGLLAQFYVGDALLKTPLNVDEVIHLSGTAQVPDRKGRVQEEPVVAWSTYHVDTKLSTSSVASFENSQCLVIDKGDPTGCVAANDPQHRLLSAFTQDYATNRRTAEAVNDPAYLPAGSTPHEGLVNKWPFLAEKKTYTFWDDGTQTGVPADYAGTTTLDGHRTYVYDASVPRTKIEVAHGVQGWYTDEKKIYVDPTTGSILDQREHQVRTDTKGKPLIDLRIAFTDGQVQRLVDDAESNGQVLNLIRNWIPVIGYGLGAPLLAIGIALTASARRRPPEEVDSEPPTTEMSPTY